jgi:hypothetical protein
MNGWAPWKSTCGFFHKPQPHRPILSLPPEKCRHHRGSVPFETCPIERIRHKSLYRGIGPVPQQPLSLPTRLPRGKTPSRGSRRHPRPISVLSPPHRLDEVSADSGRLPTPKGIQQGSPKITHQLPISIVGRMGIKRKLKIVDSE